MAYGITAAGHTDQTGFVYGYNLRTGVVSACRIGSDGTLSYAFAYQWQGGLDNTIGFSLAGRAYLFGFRSADRRAFILSADQQGNLSPTFNEQLESQWTDFAFADIT